MPESSAGSAPLAAAPGASSSGDVRGDGGRAGLAVLTLAADAVALASALAQELGADLFLHRDALAGVAPDTVATEPGQAAAGARLFDRVGELTTEIFGCYAGLIYIMPTGVVVRSLAALAQSKYTDPAVVVLDVRARHVISLLSGHEGGANDLALRVANLTGAEPVITTTTEARKDVIVGIGCRKGVPAETIVRAVQAALSQAVVGLDSVRFLATAGVKAQEPGLLRAAQELGLPLRIIPDEDIRRCPFAVGAVDESEFVQAKVGLPGVCEPAALLAGRRTELFFRKTAFEGGVTVALAREARGVCG